MLISQLTFALGGGGGGGGGAELATLWSNMKWL